MTTSVTSGQQWDAPNAWPPLVLLLIEGLIALKVDLAVTLADNIKNSWLNTCYLAYNETGFMYEKYNALEVSHITWMLCILIVVLYIMGCELTCSIIYDAC